MEATIVSTEIKATFEIASWDEMEFDAGDGLAKLTGTAVEKRYSGDIDGTSVTRWLMAYAPDETATFVGIERIQGTVGDKKGSLVLQHIGTFADGSADAALTVLSGTGDLDGASGEGTFKADPAGTVTLTLT
jgi:hypothetical protein